MFRHTKHFTEGRKRLWSWFNNENLMVTLSQGEFQNIYIYFCLYSIATERWQGKEKWGETCNKGLWLELNHRYFSSVGYRCGMFTFITCTVKPQSFTDYFNYNQCFCFLNTLSFVVQKCGTTWRYNLLCYKLGCDWILFSYWFICWIFS